MNTDNNPIRNLRKHFKYDVFISYATADDKPIEEDKQGWVSHVVDTMNIYVGGNSPDSLVIFKDSTLRANVDLNAIPDAVKKSAVFVAFLSPKYVSLIPEEVNWCQIEAEEFYKQAGGEQGAKIEERWRVFKLILHPVRREEQQPEYFRRMVNEYQYRFFLDDIDNTRLRPEYGGKIANQYFRLVGRVANHIVEMLKFMGASSKFMKASSEFIEAPSDYTSKNLIIYLAQTTSDLEEEYDSLRHELKERGYTVLPNYQLSMTVEQVQQEVKQNLHKAALSIQLIGDRYGIIPEGTDKPIPVLQDELISGYSRKNSEFLRLVWINPSADPSEPKQRNFIKHLRQSSDEKTEIITTAFQQFDTDVKQKVRRLEAQIQANQSSKSPDLTTKSAKRVYLIYDALDKDKAVPVRDYLRMRQIEVIEFRSDQASTSEEIRKLHEQNLEICDAVLIYWGEARITWLDAKKNDVRKIKNGRSPLNAAIYIGEPLNSEKNEHSSVEFGTIYDMDETLDRFLTQVIGG